MPPHKIDDIVEILSKRSCSNRIAVIDTDNEYSWKYLSGKITQFTTLIRKKKISNPVGIRMDNSIYAIVSILSCIVENIPFVPLGVDWPIKLISDICSELSINFIFELELDENNKTILKLKNTGLGFSEDNSNSDVLGREIAYVIFTSGSTGKPKGVVVSRENISNYIEWKQEKLLNLNEHDFVLNRTPLTFDVAVWEVLLPIVYNIKIVVAPTEFSKSPKILLDYIVEKKVTVINIIPNMLDELLKLVEKNTNMLSMIRIVIVGGEKFTWSLFDKLKNYDWIDFYNFYGPTETTISCTYWNVDFNYRGKDLPIGAAIDNCTIHIEADNGEITKAKNITGEVLVTGKCVAKGYTNGLSGGFTMLDGIACFRTGDLGYYDMSGNLCYVGRRDNQIKVGGVRIELESVERVLEEHSDVDTAVASIITYKQTKVLVCYLKMHNIENTDSSSVSDYIRKYLPSVYCPSDYLFVEKFPLSNSGKIDRKKADKFPVEIKHIVTEYSIKNRVKLQDAISIILDCKVDCDKSLIEYGLDSLRLHMLLSRLKQEFGIQVDLKVAYSNPRITAWENNVTCTNISNATEIVDNIDTSKASVQQQQIYFLNSIQNSNRAYNAQFLIHFQGGITVDELVSALENLQYETLTYNIDFYSIDNELFMSKGNKKACIQVTEFKELSPRISDMLEYCKSISIKVDFPLDKAQVRWFVFKADYENIYLLQVESHYVHDGWSIGLISRYLNNFLNGNKTKQNEKESYLQWASQQHENRLTSSYQSRLEEYVNLLMKNDVNKKLELGFKTTEKQTFEGGCIHFTIRRDLYSKARDKIKLLKCTLYEYFLTIFQAMIYYETGEDKFFIGTAFANRDYRNENVIGMYVNSAVLTTNIDPNLSFPGNLKNISKTLKLFLQFSDIPIVDVLSKIKLDRNVNENPLFKVMFAFHDSHVPKIESEKFTAKMYPIHNDSSKNDLNVVCIPRVEQLKCDVSCDDDMYFEVLWEYNNNIGYERAKELYDTFLYILEESLVDEYRFNKKEYSNKIEQSQISGAYIELENKNIYHDILSFQKNDFAIGFESSVINYGELSELINQRIQYFEKLNLHKGKRVCLFSIRSIEFIINFIALYKMGLCSVILDIAWSELRIEQTIIDTDSSYLINKNNILVDLKDGSVNKAEAYIVFTSGTTGRPKGIILEKKNLHQAVYSRHLAFPEKPDKLGVILPFNFDVSITAILWSLSMGGGVMLYPERFDAVKLAQRISKDKISHINVTPSIYWELLAVSSKDELNTFKRVMIGGDFLSDNIVNEHYDKLPNVMLTNEYGPTECSVWSSFREVPAVYIDNLSNNVGVPVANVDIAILNDDGTISSVNNEGEIIIGGDCLSKGYIKPHNLKDKIIKIQHKCFYKTGDYGKISCGELYIFGRIDDEIKYYGSRIHPSEIENTINEMENINDSIVRIEDNNILTVYIQAIDLNEIDVPRIRSHIRNTASSKIIPDKFYCVPEVKYSSNGKKNRKFNYKDIIINISSNSKELENNYVKNIINSLELGDYDLDLSFTANGFNSLNFISLQRKIVRLGFEELSIEEFFCDKPMLTQIQGLRETNEGIKKQDKNKDYFNYEMVSWFFNHDSITHDKFFQRKIGKIDPELNYVSVLERLKNDFISRSEFFNKFYIKEGVVNFTKENSLSGNFNLFVLDFDDLESVQALVHSQINKLSIKSNCLFDISPFKLNSDNTVYISFVFHHLIVDYASWGIIKEMIIEASNYESEQCI